MRTAGGDRGAEALSGSLTFHHNRGERDAAPTARDILPAASASAWSHILDTNEFFSRGTFPFT